MMRQSIILYALFMVPWCTIAGAQNDLNSWPKGPSPVEIGRKVAKRFIASPHGVYNAPGTRPHIPHFEVCTWYGALTFANLTGDNDLRLKLIERFIPLFDKDSSLLPIPDHGDYAVFGAVPLEIFLQSKEYKYLIPGKIYADTQWGIPTGPRVIPESHIYHNKGYTWQTRL